MNTTQLVVIDNDTQDIFVNGRKWEKSPESYLHLAPKGVIRGPAALAAKAVVVDSRLAAYQKMQREATQPFRPLWRSL